MNLTKGFKMENLANTLISACAVSTILSGVVLAAAKSIFVLKSKIYDTNGMPIYVPQIAFDKALEGKHLSRYMNRDYQGKKRLESKDRRNDLEQRNLLHKIDQLQVAIDTTTAAQNDTNKSLTRLLGQLDHLIRE